MENDSIITVRDLTKYYGKTHALDGVSLDIKKGTVYGLVGENGAGKTTFLKIAAGLINSTSGVCNIKENTVVGNLIEEAGLFKTFNAFDNLKAKAIALGYKYSKEEINDLIDLVNLTDAKNKKAGEYSLGMRQRLGIALALVGNPELLLLDEPINGLDPAGIVEVRNLILKLKEERNVTIVISSHILDELAKVATDICVIHKGKVVTELTMKQLEKDRGKLPFDEYYLKLISGRENGENNGGEKNVELN